MNKYIGFLIGIIFIVEIGYSQNAIVGSGFTTEWGWGGATCPTGNTDFVYFNAGAGTSFISGSLIPDGSGTLKWRLGVDWAVDWAGSTTVTSSQFNNGSTSDVTVVPGTKYSLNNICTTTGKLSYTVSSTNNRYIFKTLDAGTSPTGTWIFFELNGDPVIVSNVFQTPFSSAVSGSDTVVVTAGLSANLTPGQGVYLRYTTNNNYSNSTVVQMTGNAKSYNAKIPPTGLNNTTSYYVFTSGISGPNPNGSDADFYTINLNNNSGSNYSYKTKTVMADFTINDSTQCLTGNSFVDTNKSTTTTGTLNYIWKFGDGSIVNTASSNNQTHSYSKAGTFSDTLIVSNGTDIDTMIKYLIKKSLSITGCNKVVYNGSTYANSSIVMDTVLNNCDTVITTATITLNYYTASSDSVSLNGCGSVTFNSIKYSSSTIFMDTLKTIQGCDSIYRKVIISITQPLVPKIIVTSNPSSTSISGGTIVSFLATATNGGTSPTYQWEKNSIKVGIDSSIYIDSNLNNGDVIKCILTSNYSCVTTPTSTSNSLTFTVSSTILSFTPSIGQKGDTIIIAGYGFKSISLVSFGGINAQWYTTINANTIKAVVSSGATGSVKVTTPVGSSSLAGFIYNGNITRNGLSPEVVPSSGGYTTGTGVTLSWTMGQPFNTTLSAGGNMLSQGEQQTAVVSNYTIAGNIWHPKGYYITNIPVKLNSVDDTITDATVLYSLNTSNVSNFIVKQDSYGRLNPTLRSADRLQVTSLDIALVQAHILQKNILNSPYKIIAADVNGDGKVSALDIVFMKRLILAIDTSFPGNKLWGFVDSSFVFTNPAIPFPHKDSIAYTGLSANTYNQTFAGFILGDVNWSATSPRPALQKDIQLYYNQIKTLNNGQIVISVMVRNFKNIIGMQYTLNFDNPEMKIVGLQNNLLGIQYADHSDGKTSFLWNEEHNNARTLEDGTVLFELVFKPMNQLNNITLDLNGSVTAVEAVDEDFNLHGITLSKETPVNISETWIVAPNPTKDGVIKVQMNLKEKKTIVFRLSDNTGKLLFIKQVEAVKGKNIITLREGNIPAGTYYLQAVGIEGEEVKKILIN